MKKKPLSRFLVGGCDEIDGKWHAVFEIHSPCNGGEHRGCTVVERNVSPPLESKEAAIQAVLEIKDESGLDGWETVGAKA
jgi:hypothetical protein